jgi:predicted DNA-binding transcriptional regulator AlpA
MLSAQILSVPSGQVADPAKRDNPDDLIASRCVKIMCGNVSDMTLWRWGKCLGFPSPDVTINRRKFWRRSTITAWIAAQADAK